MASSGRRGWSSRQLFTSASMLALSSRGMVDWVPLKTSVDGCRPALASFISRAAKRFWLGKSTYSHFTSTPYILFMAATTARRARTSSMMAWAMSVPPSALAALINSSSAAVRSAAVATAVVAKQNSPAASSAFVVPWRRFLMAFLLWLRPTLHSLGRGRCECDSTAKRSSIQDDSLAAALAHGLFVGEVCQRHVTVPSLGLPENRNAVFQPRRRSFAGHPVGPVP